MALLANRIPQRSCQPRRVHDIAAAWLGGMRGAVSMAAVASHSAEFAGIEETVQRSGNEPGGARVAEEAFAGQRPVQIRRPVVGVAWRHVPGLAQRIVAYGRLVQVPILRIGERSAHAPRADEELKWKPPPGPRHFQPSAVSYDFVPRARRRVPKTAGTL